MKNSPTFGFFRRNFFPIHNHELKKFLYLSGIFFFISFNYAVLRALKDTLVLSGSGGSEAINACKLFGVLPVFLFFNVIYNNVSQSFGRIARFNIIVAYFLLFFAFFGLVLYPNIENFQFSEGFADRMTDYMRNLFPSFMAVYVPLDSLKGFWGIIQFWPVTIYYIHAEAWGTFVLSILFYTFANEIVSTKQSGRFYPFLSIAANIGTIFAGLFTMGVFSIPKPDVSMFFVVINGLVLMVLYTYFSRLVAEHASEYGIGAKKPKKKKIKLSTKEAFKILWNSNYLRLIGFLVVSYSMCIVLYEAVYRDYLRDLTGTWSQDWADAHNIIDAALIKAKKSEYLQYYAGLQLTSIGIMAIVLSLFFATPAMKLGWRFMGSVSPSMFLLFYSFFVSILFFINQLGFVADRLGITLAMLVLCVGLSGVVFIKGSKYTFFDPFKENAYLPLTKEEKMLGKASVETLSRWGKALSSLFITMIIKPYFDGVRNFRMPIGFIILIIVVTWLIAVQDLTSRFNAIVNTIKGRSREASSR